MASESSGLALVYREDASFPTPRLAIARTEDGARTWNVFHSWEVPRTNDPNERGHLGLVVG